jgi:hypothetical protein
MKLPVAILTTLVAFLFGAPAKAALVEFFDPSQTYVLVQSGVTFDVIESEGYRFTYTRDKLFTGGLGGGPIGRAERVSWPDGVEAQAVTTGPVLSGAKLTLTRVDGAVFNLPAFTLKLLANTAGAGAHLEIMPQLDGEDAFNEGFMFNATGFYGGSFNYDLTTPSYLGNTGPLHSYEAYKMSLYVDFAITGMTLVDASIPEPTAGRLLLGICTGAVVWRRRSR